jgi:hypothetical protein
MKRATHALSRFIAAVGLVAVLLGASPAAAASTYEASPDTYRRLVRTLRAGDTLALAAGEYREGLPLLNLSGEPDRPITISGPTSGPPAVFIARAEHNTVSIVDSHHVVVRNLVLDGRGLPVDGVKAEGHAHWAHHITLENLVIRGHGNNQQNVGISTKCPAWSWVIRGNTIVGAGTGIYLGNSDGSAPFVAGLIERNLIVDTIGYNLQVKHQHPRPDVPGMPVTSSVTVIRHNVFANPAGGSPTDSRPNVLVGHWPLTGPGADDRYVVYGNFFYQNRFESLFQGEGNVALYDNLFVNRFGDAIRIQPHNDIPKRIDIAFNTVLALDAGITVTQGAGSSSFRQSVVANAVFAGVPISGGEEFANFTAPLSDAERYLTQPFAPPGQLDLFPRAPLATAIDQDVPNPATLPDWTRDFNGRLRKPHSIGAYGDSGANPGWLPALELMPE